MKLSTTVREAVADVQVQIPEEEGKAHPGAARSGARQGAVLNTLTSTSGQRTYDHAIREFVGWYCSPATVNLRLAAVPAHRVRSSRRRPPEPRTGGRNPAGEGRAADWRAPWPLADA